MAESARAGASVTSPAWGADVDRLCVTELATEGSDEQRKPQGHVNNPKMLTEAYLGPAYKETSMWFYEYRSSLAVA